MKAIFSRQFPDDLIREESRYSEISEGLGSAFHERIAGPTREIIRWRGSDHVGPHGFPCRHTKPFPFFIYYQVQWDKIYCLGLVHECRHPDFLKGLIVAARRRPAG